MRATLSKVFLVLIFACPLCIWFYTSDVYSYYRYGSPVGQIWYVSSKLFGLYAVLLLWFQAISSLLKDTRYWVKFPCWTMLRHQYIGTASLFLVVLHVFSFTVATSLRKDTFAWRLLLPDFSDFYHTSISVGLFAFLILIFSFLVAIFRTRIPFNWRYLHRGMLIAIALGIIHSFLIGTETRYGVYKLFYFLLVFLFSASLLMRFWGNRKETLLK